ncbi:hypothetical protein QFC20_004727 [Naganishia adeliensis]|uniref:Uncharacterized protein n=1 Tax=Naganishia adeliensis TaxID=92952 RepID=A0ACC2VX24_9TREE|nr:hypothetical protein QFC20_004727 [Naganishia adeliensis]
MLDLFRTEVKRYAFLWPVFYHPVSNNRAGVSRFKNDWPMKDLLMRTMKNERDGLKRPKIYAREAPALLNRAREHGKTAVLIETPIIRFNNHGMQMKSLYDVDHASDDEGDEEEEDEEGIARADGSNGKNGVERELTARQKDRLAQEEREQQQLETGDVQYFDLDEEIQALALIEGQNVEGQECGEVADDGEQLLEVGDESDTSLGGDVTQG